MSKQKIYIALPQDRDAVVTILARNGYTVRQGKERRGKTYDKFVEFCKEGEPHGNDRTTGADSSD